MPIDHPNRADETDIAGTLPASYAALRHRNGDPRHSRDIAADLRRQIRQHSPETATRAAIADRHELPVRTGPRPHRVDPITADQMNQPRFSSPSEVIMSLLAGRKVSELRVDLVDGLTHEEAAQVYGLVLAPVRLAAETLIHNPQVLRLIHEMRHDLRREDDVLTRRYGFVNTDNAVLGQVDDLIVTEKEMIHRSADPGHPAGQASDPKPRREGALNEFDKPYGT